MGPGATTFSRPFPKHHHDSTIGPIQPAQTSATLNLDTIMHQQPLMTAVQEHDCFGTNYKTYTYKPIALHSSRTEFLPSDCWTACM